MPKELPIERFRIWIDDVDPADVGPTVAALTKLGRGKVGFELIEDVRSFAKKASHEVNAAEFLAPWIAEHPTFRATEVVKHFEANGRSGGSAYSALTALAENKVLKKLGPGNYARADIKHLAGPSAPKKIANAQKYAVPNATFALRAARRSHGRCNITSLKRLFEKDGRNPASVSPTLNDLIEKKLLKRVNDGEYVMLQAKPPSNRSPKPNEQPKPNGSAQIVETAQHG